MVTQRPADEWPEGRPWRVVFIGDDSRVDRVGHYSTEAFAREAASAYGRLCRGWSIVRDASVPLPPADYEPRAEQRQEGQRTLYLPGENGTGAL